MHCGFKDLNMVFGEWQHEEIDAQVNDEENGKEETGNGHNEFLREGRIMQ